MKTSPEITPSGLMAMALAVSLPAGSKAARGMTLPEIVVGVGVGSLILMVMGMIFMTSARSFAAMGNYVGMDANSRNALDRMTREIRQADRLTEFTPTTLKFARIGQTNSFLVYEWDPATHELVGWNTAETTESTLLSKCDQLAFSMCNGAFAPTTNIAESKAIRVTWKCSRTILGSQTNSEDMQQALIVMRNKPL